MKNKHSFYITLFLTFILIGSAFGQKKFTVNYIYTDSVKGPGFYFKFLKPYNGYPFLTIEEFKLIDQKKKTINNQFITQVTYETTDHLSQAIISDGYGHNSFIIPNDTINIRFKKLTKANGTYILNGKYPSFWFNDFEYEGKNKYTYMLFDSLAFYTGVLDSPPIGLGESKSNLAKYFDTVRTIYTTQLAYINTYAEKYHLPKQVVKYAVSEVNSALISRLLEPVASSNFNIELDDYPKDIIKLLDITRFNDRDLFTNTLTYSLTAYKYIYLYKFKLTSPENDANIKFKKVYDYINRSFPDKEIRKFLLASHLIANVSYRLPYFDAAYKDFGKQFTGSKLVSYTDSLYSKQKEGWKIKLEDALNVNVFAANGMEVKLQSLLTGKPTVIDCWASWCIPCLKQMPYSAKLEDQFKDQVQFLYLSFDKNKEAWITKSESLNLKNSYLLPANFKSAFAKHFDISTIPRYLIFDKTGKIITGNAPRPSKNEDLIKILNKLIKQK